MFDARVKTFLYIQKKKRKKKQNIWLNYEALKSKETIGKYINNDFMYLYIHTHTYIIKDFSCKFY